MGGAAGLAAFGALASAEGEHGGDGEEGDQWFHRAKSYPISRGKWSGFPDGIPVF
jgi:hypothetical protein